MTCYLTFYPTFQMIQTVSLPYPYTQDFSIDSLKDFLGSIMCQEGDMSEAQLDTFCFELSNLLGSDKNSLVDSARKLDDLVCST